MIARTHCVRERLAMRVSARHAAEIRPIAQAHAGDEERHWMLWQSILLSQR
jgi:putative heme iron utilization protein